MANLPESATYDAGVYQLELTDPVQGGPTGVSNAPLKNLANRTAWLKSQIDGIKDGAVGLALYARLASPTFTGSPSAPTAALGDNTTKLATTAFVQATLGGFLSKSIAGTGSVTLTAVEAGNGIIELTGALTGNRDVIVPSSPTRPWIIRNATTGAFSVTVKTAAGTGVVVAQGQNADVFCDGTNVLMGESWAAPLASPALTGNPTAPTAAKFNNGTSIATTAFVRAVGVELSDQVVIETNSTLLASHAGKRVSINGAGVTVTLPAANSLLGGSGYLIANVSPASVTVSKQGTDTIEGGFTSIVLKPQEQIWLATDGNGVWWRVIDGSNSGFTMRNPASLAANGYQKLPSGLIIQWGLCPDNNGTVMTQTLPIAFPNDFLNVVISQNGTTITPRPFAAAIMNNSQFAFLCPSGSSGLGSRFVAIGY